MQESASPLDIERTDTSKKTLVSILNWNGTTETLACLATLDRTAAPELHFVVLDNGSTVDPSERFAAECPDLEYIRLPANLGFTGGHNHVMRLALERGFGNVMLLNNDCQIGLTDLRKLRETLAADPKLGAVSPLIYRDDASRLPMMVGGWFDWLAHKTIRPNSADTVKPTGASTFLVGTALLLRCDVLRKIGLLDDRYFAYFEDNEISARLAKNGFGAAYCREANCLHDYRSLHEYGAMALYLLTRNAWLFWIENTPAAARKGLRRHLVSSFLHDLALLKKNRAAPDKLDALCAGCWDGFNGRFGRPPTEFNSPWLMRKFAYLAPYFISQFLRSPLSTIKAKLQASAQS